MGAACRCEQYSLLGTLGLSMYASLEVSGVGGGGAGPGTKRTMKAGRPQAGGTRPGRHEAGGQKRGGGNAWADANVRPSLQALAIIHALGNNRYWRQRGGECLL